MANMGTDIGADLMKWLQQFTGAAQQQGATDANPALQYLASLMNGEQNGTFQDLISRFSGMADSVQHDYSFLRGNEPNFSQGIGDLVKSLNTGIDRSNDILNFNGRTENSSNVFNQGMGIAQNGLGGDFTDAAYGLMRNGGMSADMTQALQQAQRLTDGQGFTPELFDAQSNAMSALAAGGRTSEGDAAKQQFMNLINSGGRDAGTAALSNAGQGLLQNGGYSPQMSGSLAQAMNLAGRGGFTDQMQQLFNPMMDIVKNGGQGGALLPMDAVLSGARDEAGLRAAQQSVAERQKAVARTGSAMLAGNAQNDLAASQDQILRQQSSAVHEAMTDQQKLQLQQLLGAGGIAGDLTKTAGSNLSSSLGLQGELARSAASNIATGGGMMSDAEKVAAQRLGVGATGFNSAISNDISRYGVANDLLKNVNNAAFNRMGLGFDTQTRLSGLASGNVAAGMQGLQSDAGIRLGGLDTAQRMTAAEFGREMNAFQAQQGLSGLGINAYLGQQGLDLQSLSQQYNQMIAALGGAGQQNENQQNNMLGGANGLTNLAQLFFGNANAGMGQMGNIGSSLIQAATQPGFWARLAQTATGGLIGGVASGIGTRIGGG